MNPRMPNGTSVWCGRTAGVIPPPTRLRFWTSLGTEEIFHLLNHHVAAHIGNRVG